MSIAQIHKSIDVQGIYVGSREMFEAMNPGDRSPSNQTCWDRVFPFSETKAYRHLQVALGKIVIQL